MNTELDCEWSFDQYEARKLIVRTDADGEPVVYGASESVKFQAFFFITWRGFDSSSARDYAECVSFSMSPREILDRMSENGKDSDRKLSRLKFVMIPVKCIYFVNADLASKLGLHPNPDQDKNFPERITRVPPALTQPPRPNKRRQSPETPMRIHVASRNGTGRISLEAISDIPVLGSGIELRVSRIPGAGRGIYTSRDFEVNEMITTYFGHTFGERQREHMQKEGVGTHCKPLQLKHSYLDGVKVALTGMGAGQLANQGSKSTINCDWIYLDVRGGSKILGLRATRFIHPGEELYVNYGTKFWSEQNIEPNLPPDVVLPATPEEPVDDVMAELASLRTEIAALKEKVDALSEIEKRITARLTSKPK